MTLLAPALEPGDTIRLVSPASTPSREYIAQVQAYLRTLGLNVELGPHAFDRLGYLAGTRAVLDANAGTLSVDAAVCRR